MPLEAADDLGAGGVIGAHHRAQVLGIEPRGELGRADQVTEQHGQLAALGLDRPRRSLLCHCPWRTTIEQSDCVEQPAAMSDRGDAERNQVLGGQPRQHLGVDVVGAEGLEVIREAQIPQPARDVHHRRPG